MEKTSTAIKIGKRNLDLLLDIRKNKNLKRKELVDFVVNHPEFIHKKSEYARNLAWNCIQAAKKSKVNKAYEILDRRILICWFDFSMVLYR